MLSPVGEVVALRCKRRHCPHCAHLEARELARVLTNDANEGTAPTVAITLTTVDPATTLKTFRHGTQMVFQALRRRFGRGVEYMQIIEFTTGRGRRAGGRRRMHAHSLVKGLPLDALEEAEAIVRGVWRGVTGAYVIEVAQLRTVGGIIGYLGLHHMKPEQAPPPGWEGQRVRWSRGYLGGVTTAAARGRARRELAAERTWWSVERQADDLGLPEEWMEAEFERRMRLRTEASEGGEWRRIRLHPLPAPETAPGTPADALGAPLHARAARGGPGREPAAAMGLERISPLALLDGLQQVTDGGQMLSGLCGGALGIGDAALPSVVHDPNLALDLGHDRQREDDKRRECRQQQSEGRDQERDSLGLPVVPSQHYEDSDDRHEVHEGHAPKEPERPS
jgi:hypothetical protein